jgi:hypothetical protein
MGKWIRKFSERAWISTDSVDTLSTLSTLSVSTQAHSDNLHAVGAGSSSTIADPVGPCAICGLGQWWQRPGSSWHCRACKPDVPLEATTLTLPCHNIHSRPVRDPAHLRRMVELACRRLTITPEQLWQELEANGNLADLESGAVSVKVLREVAMTLASMRAHKIPPERGS